jgi:hypothetical protein
MKIISILKVNIIVILLSVIFMNYGEVLHLFSHSNVNLTVLETSIFVKVLKDILFLSLFFLLITWSLVRAKVTFSKKGSWVLLFIFFAILSFFLTLVGTIDHLVVVAGLRWLFPVFFAYLMIGLVDDEMQNLIYKWLLVVFFVGFLLQVLEVFYLKDFFGHNFLGLNLRNPGFYIVPNTMAFFTSVVMYYTISFSNSKYKVVLIPLQLLSIYLTASGTGFIIAATMLLIYLIYKFNNRKILLPGVVALLLLFVFNLQFLIGRDDIFVSAELRLEMLLRSITLDNILFSTNFGQSTNTAIMLFSNKYISNTGLITADSVVSSIIANTGVVALLICLFGLLKMSSLSKSFLIFIVVFGLFSLTTITFEAYPISLLLSINVAYFVYKKTERNKLQQKMVVDH